LRVELLRHHIATKQEHRRLIRVLVSKVAAKSSACRFPARCNFSKIASNRSSYS
jgi:hypothetical protein